MNKYILEYNVNWLTNSEKIKSYSDLEKLPNSETLGVYKGVKQCRLAAASFIKNNPEKYHFSNFYYLKVDNKKEEDIKEEYLVKSHVRTLFVKEIREFLEQKNNNGRN